MLCYVVIKFIENVGQWEFFSCLKRRFENYLLRCNSTKLRRAR